MPLKHFSMFIKIYWNEKTIFLSEKSDNSLHQFLQHNNTTFIETNNETDVVNSITKIRNPDSNHFIITHDNLDFLKDNFFSQFTLIEAAGGIVLNINKEILFIFRRGKWDLPKGKMEVGETPEICAEREIEEETGVGQLELKNKITDTYHIYEERGLEILKKTYWYFFTTSFEGTPQPQTEEDISSISWIGKEKLDQPLSNTYQSITDVIEKCISIF